MAKKKKKKEKQFCYEESERRKHIGRSSESDSELRAMRRRNFQSASVCQQIITFRVKIVQKRRFEKVERRTD